MKIVTPAEFVTQPWRNGGGITHEILREDRGGTLLLRLSIAEVASDGPFSAFPGLARILTVVEGEGLHLHTADGRVDALPLKPVAFPGDIPVTCRRLDGNVRDFNVIYDPSRISAHVRILTPDVSASCAAAPGRSCAALALGSGAEIDGHPLADGCIAVFAAGRVSAGARSHILLATFDEI